MKIHTVQTRGTIIGQDNGFAQAKSLLKPFINLGLNVETVKRTLGGPTGRGETLGPLYTTGIE